MSDTTGGRRRSTTVLLHDAIDAHAGDDITLDILLEQLRSSAFGVVLLVLAIPNFIPLPIGIGGLMGTLVLLLALQMLFGLEHPLVPGPLRRRTIRRARLKSFLARSARVMNWLERWCKPRLVILTRRPWSQVSGLALVVYGLLLLLPIPFTNYPFGVLLLAFAFGLIERDGALLVVIWALAAILAVLALLFSGALLQQMRQVFDMLQSL